MTYTVADLFCGCGGLSRGLSNAGFDVVLGMDSWKPAIDTYSANNPDHPGVIHDLSDIQSTIDVIEQLYPYGVDIVAGGPPCQDFSSAGSRIEGAKADLTVAYAKTVIALQPRAFIMENVERATISNAFQTAVELLCHTGYGLTLKVLDASLCGVPQKRKRLFMVGVKGSPDGWFGQYLEKGLSPEPMSVRKYLGDEIDFEHYYRHPRSYARRGIYSIDEPSATIRGVNRPMPPDYRQHEGDSTQPDGVRALTTYERSRIQTFPKDWIWTGKSKTAIEQMIGNAVPPALGEFVGRALMSHLKKLDGEHYAKAA